MPKQASQDSHTFAGNTLGTVDGSTLNGGDGLPAPKMKLWS